MIDASKLGKMPTNWKAAPPLEETLLSFAKKDKEIRHRMVRALLHPHVEKIRQAPRRSDVDLAQLARAANQLAPGRDDWSNVRDYYVSRICGDHTKVVTGRDARFLRDALREDSHCFEFDTQTLSDEMGEFAATWDENVDLRRPAKPSRGRPKDEWVQRRAVAVHLLIKCGETQARALDVVEQAARQSGHAVARESIKRNYERLRNSIDDLLDVWLLLMAPYLGACVRSPSP